VVGPEAVVVVLSLLMRKNRVFLNLKGLFMKHIILVMLFFLSTTGLASRIEYEVGEIDSDNIDAKKIQIFTDEEITEIHDSPFSDKILKIIFSFLPKPERNCNRFMDSMIIRIETKKNGEVSSFCNFDHYHDDSNAGGSVDRMRVIIEYNREFGIKLRSQVRNLNIDIREALKEEDKLLEKQTTIKIYDKDQSLVEREFCLGDRIYFTKNSRNLGVNNGTFGKVINIEEDKKSHKVTVITDLKKIVSFSTREYKNIEHGYAVTAYKSQGDTVDKSYYMVSERSSKEASYVIMSRHRLNAKLYVDRSGFSQNIDWNALKGMDKKEIAKTFNEIAITQAASSMQKPQEKDTSLDYKKDIGVTKEREHLISPTVHEYAQRLHKTTDKEKKVKLIYGIAIAYQGSEHKLKTPTLKPAQYQRLAADILKQKDLDGSELLVKDILKTKIGHDVRPSKKMEKYKESLVNEVKPFAQDALSHVQHEKDLAKQITNNKQKEQSISKGKSKGHSRGYGIDIGF